MRRHFEELELRRLLAVEVAYIPGSEAEELGDLYFIGNGADDSITITEDIVGNYWEIRGINTTVSLTGSPGFEDGDSVYVPKPSVQNVHIFLDGGNDTLVMQGINQGIELEGYQEVATVTFVGKTDIQMGFGFDTVSLGSYAAPTEGDINYFNPEEGAPFIGSNANDFIGALSIDVGGGVSSNGENDAENTVTIVNTDLGRVGHPPFERASSIDEGVRGQLIVLGSGGVDTITLAGVNAFPARNSPQSPLHWALIDIQTHEAGDIVLLGVRNGERSLAQSIVTLGGSLNVDGASGNDSIVVESVHASGNMTIYGGAGGDNIRIGSPVGTPPPERVGSSTGKDMVLQGDEGDDFISVNQATTVNAFLIGLGGGANRLVLRNSSFSNDSAILGGEGADHLDLDAVNFVKNLYIQTGGGADVIDLQGTLVTAGVLTISSDQGDDQVRVDNSSIVGLVLATADGNDNVLLTANLIDDLFVDLGAGNDSLFGSNTYRRGAIVHGGPGDDALAGSDPGAINVFFESFAP